VPGGAPVIDGLSATFTREGPWALIDFLRAYRQPTPGAKTELQFLVNTQPRTGAPGAPAKPAQAKLFAALQGRLGPDGAALPVRLDRAPADDLVRLSTEFAASATGEYSKGNALLDPWGRRYLYFYKEADNPAAWGQRTYILYSAGPDGRHQSPDLAAGPSDRDSRIAVVNADNVYADTLNR
jgi:hypothetical protein